MYAGRTLSCRSQQNPIVTRGLRRLTEDAWLTSMKELVTRSSSSMGIPPHPTCGATSCLIAKGSDGGRYSWPDSQQCATGELFAVRMGVAKGRRFCEQRRLWQHQP